MKFQAIKLPKGASKIALANNMRQGPIITYQLKEEIIAQYKQIFVKPGQYNINIASITHEGGNTDYMKDCKATKEEVDSYLEECKKFGVQSPVLILVSIRKL